jgi:hypothetical protein
MGGAGHVDVQGIHHRLAHVQRVEQRQFLAVLQNQLGQAQQNLLALARRHPRPGALLESLAGAAYRQIDLDLAARSAPTASPWDRW